ncbi:MAG TPA: class I SAM-dependent methyltransferase [Bacteroidia bacterium]|nr:class I SAM-dependent methyltransferase [Bacteroidia bacterium]HNT80383.1 class I SAM-dependent methyltransferase [Bacteroidia bacterium]
MVDYINPKTQLPLFEKNDQLCDKDGNAYPIINSIPRFVHSDNYAKAFGLQWKSFAKIQLDSFNKSDISKDRLERCLGFPISDLKSKTVLEVGCGAGRFTEHLVSAGALVHSIDLSEAVEVNLDNMNGAKNHRVAQANVYELPFLDQSFDVVICLGVVQHTPDPEKTIDCLFKKVKSGGLLVIDHYTFDWMYLLKPILLYRFFLKRMKPEKSKKIVDRLVDSFFPWHWKFKESNLMRLILNRISPCYTYFKQFPKMDREFHYQLCRLDTYDGLTDFHKHLRTEKQIKVILNKLNGKNIEVWKGGNGIEARCKK